MKTKTIKLIDIVIERKENDLMSYELHPLCALFPRLTGSEFESLKDDIRENGLREPIIIHEGMILDGGNRYRACLETGIEPCFMKFGGVNFVSYVISANLHRRHLTPGQQAAIVASAQDWGKAQTVGNPQLRNVAQLDTAKDRSSQSGASIRTQQMADKVAKADLELAKMVGHGEISLPKAILLISQQKPEISQDEEYDQKEHELQEAHDTINYLVEENTKLRDSLAAGQLPDDEIVSAEQTMIDLRKQVKTLEAELCAVKSSRNIYQRENEELKKQCRMYENKFKKLGAGNAKS